MIAFFQALIIALLADPAIILRQPNSDPYAPWVVAIAKAKLWLLPWHWGAK